MEQILTATESFVKSIDDSYFVTWGSQFYCDLSTGEISLGFGELYDEDYNKMFADYLRELGAGKYADTITPFTWAVLHEVGHLETVGDDVEDDTLLKQMLYMGVKSDNLKDVYECEHAYMRLPSEAAATGWAVGYVLDNPAVVTKLDTIIQANI